jgi:poly-gamma-glutamate capsule biosynthesis protein CapA/YwtB (metallophosphatase superfamily)
MAHSEISLFLAGDAIITRPWSHVRDDAFLGLVDEIRAADVAIANLETVIHEFQGYAQADCGGTYLTSPPEVASELKWAGFDMLAHANNHTFDYGTSGVLETIGHVERAGLILAGSGADLQNARAPRYCRRNGGTVALVAMASDFVPYGKASYSRADQPGRPGLNPLSVIRERVVLVPELIVKRLRALARFIGRRPAKVEAAPFRLGFSFIGSARGWRVVAADLEANLAAISEAASNADIVVASVHAHGHGPWLADFARRAIERGAHLVLVHGQHRILGIELYRGRPIFYSMGDFVFEVEHISRFPAEEYAGLGLAPDAMLNDLKAAKRKQGLFRKRRVFEGFTTSISVSGGRVTQIRLMPTDLQFDAGGESRGRPQLASPELGRRIIETVAQRSRRYGTSIRYDAGTNRGEVALESPAGVPTRSSKLP